MIVPLLPIWEYTPNANNQEALIAKTKAMLTRWNEVYYQLHSFVGVWGRGCGLQKVSTITHSGHENPTRSYEDDWGAKQI